MKIKLIALACAFGAIASVAQAEDAYTGSWYALPTLGYMFSDSDLKADDDVAYGVRLGKQISEHWDVQLGLTHSRADEDDAALSSGKYRQTLFGLDALYMFSRDKFRPFVLAGFGAANNRVNYTAVTGANPHGSNTSWMANVGAGVQYFITETIGLQADVRHVWSRAEDSSSRLFGGDTEDTVGNTYLNFGLIFNFGAPKSAAQPVVQEVAYTAPASDMSDIAHLKK